MLYPQLSSSILAYAVVINQIIVVWVCIYDYFYFSNALYMVFEDFKLVGLNRFLGASKKSMNRAYFVITPSLLGFFYFTRFENVVNFSDIFFI